MSAHLFTLLNLIAHGVKYLVESEVKDKHLFEAEIISLVSNKRLARCSELVKSLTLYTTSLNDEPSFDFLLLLLLLFDKPLMRKPLHCIPPHYAIFITSSAVILTK